MISGHLIWVSNGKDEPLFIAALPNPGDRPVFRLGFGKGCLMALLGGKEEAFVLWLCHVEKVLGPQGKGHPGRTDFDFPSSILFFRSEHLQQKCYFLPL
jgi:hypothetical protein